MRSRLFDLVVVAFCLLLQGYFGWHYLYGSRSSATLAAMEEEAERVARQLAAEIAVRQGIEAKVVLLRPEHLDPDMLDEIARRTLSYNAKRELIVRFKHSDINNIN